MSLAVLSHSVTTLVANHPISADWNDFKAEITQAALAYALQVEPEAEVEQQAFQLLIKQLGQASSVEVQSVLATREHAEP